MPPPPKLILFLLSCSGSAFYGSLPSPEGPMLTFIQKHLLGLLQMQLLRWAGEIPVLLRATPLTGGSLLSFPGCWISPGTFFHPLAPPPPPTPPPALDPHVAVDLLLVGGPQTPLWTSIAVTRVGCQKPQLLPNKGHPVGALTYTHTHKHAS